LFCSIFKRKTRPQLFCCSDFFFFTLRWGLPSWSALAWTKLGCTSLFLSFFFSLSLSFSRSLTLTHTLFFSSIHYSPPSVKHTPTHPFPLPLSLSLSFKVLSFLAITTLFRSASQVERQVIVLAGLGNNCSLNSSSKEIHFCSVFHVTSSNRCWSTLVFIQYT